MTAASNQQGFVCCWGHLGPGCSGPSEEGKGKNEQATYVFFSWVAPRMDLERRLFGVLLAFEKHQTRKLTVMLFHGAPQLEISPACFPWRRKAEQKSGSLCMSTLILVILSFPIHGNKLKQHNKFKLMVTSYATKKWNKKSRLNSGIWEILHASSQSNVYAVLTVYFRSFFGPKAA